MTTTTIVIPIPHLPALSDGNVDDATTTTLIRQQQQQQLLMM